MFGRSPPAVVEEIGAIAIGETQHCTVTVVERAGGKRAVRFQFLECGEPIVMLTAGPRTVAEIAALLVRAAQMIEPTR